MFVERSLDAGATERERLELPLTPILEVRKPPTSAPTVAGLVHVYVGSERRESVGVFASGGDAAVFSPSTIGPCRVVVLARFYGREGELLGLVRGEQEVDLQRGVRSVVAPNYLALASLRVRVLSPNGTPVSASQFALRCAEARTHDCLDEHQALGGSLGGTLTFAEEEEGEDASPPDPAPLLGAHEGFEEVYVRPGTWEVLASGNDPELTRGSARIALEAGARRTLEVRLAAAERIEVRVPPEPRGDDTELTVEGPPGARVRLEAGLLTVEGLRKGDRVRVRVSRWVENEVWGEEVLLSAGARRDLRLARAGVLELELTRKDGSPSDVEWRVSPDTPPDLGRYRVVLNDERDRGSWLAGDSAGHFGPVTHELISSVLDDAEEGGVYQMRLLPGLHLLEIDAAEGQLRLPVSVSAGTRVRIERVVERP